jgi:hemerythrin-like domain-containing protein
MSPEPIKRGKALMPLSREHHIDLLLAWKIRQGLKNNVSPGRMAAYIQYLDDHLMAAHFRDEEKLLFDQLPAEDMPCMRARKEHQQIRQMMHEICEKHSDDLALFNRFADTVEAHVRYEERELFPYLENKLSAEKLEGIEQVIAGNHGAFSEIWDDEFWLEK